MYGTFFAPNEKNCFSHDFFFEVVAKVTKPPNISFLADIFLIFKHISNIKNLPNFLFFFFFFI